MGKDPRDQITPLFKVHIDVPPIPKTVRFNQQSKDILVFALTEGTMSVLT